MISPFDFFDKIYCINLPPDTQRWSDVSIQFNKVGILDRVEQIYVTPPYKEITLPTLRFPRGEIGVSLSQTKAVIHALAAGANNVLIFEDDVTFEDNTLEVLSTALSELPQDWDVLFFGGNPIDKMVTHSTTLNKTGKFLCAHAYALPKKNMLKLYDTVMDSVTLMPYDGVTSNISLLGNGYVVNPPICWQAAGHSVIRNGKRDYMEFLKNQWIENGTTHPDDDK